MLPSSYAGFSLGLQVAGEFGKVDDEESPLGLVPCRWVWGPSW